MRADALEQLFVRPRAGGLELLLVLESEAGDRERVTLQPPRAGGGGPRLSEAAGQGDAEQMAIEHLARWLERRGCSLSPRLRVRRERGGSLADAPALRKALQRVFSELQEEQRWE